MKSQPGQALLELAVLGSLMIVVLGAIVNYGLNADTNQQAMMTSFRQALSSAAQVQQPGTPISASHLVIHSRHFPDPSNPFAIGSVVPATASAGGIARSNMLGRVFPDRPSELPRMQIQVSGEGPTQRPGCAATPEGCTTANLRADNAPAGSLGRYQEVFGSGSVCDCNASKTPNCARGQSLCAGSPSLGQHRLLILDQCDGEILDYHGCLRQARLIMDSAYCQRECEKGGADNCAATCKQPMTVPWYAQGCQMGRAGWTCPELTKLFENLPGRSLGLQADSFRDMTLKNTLERTESGQTDDDQQQSGRHPRRRSTIGTTSSVDWTENATRTMVYHTTDAKTAVRPVTTRVERQNTTVWTTEWDKHP